MMWYVTVEMNLLSVAEYAWAYQRTPTFFLFFGTKEGLPSKNLVYVFNGDICVPYSLLWLCQLQR